MKQQESHSSKVQSRINVSGNQVKEKEISQYDQYSDKQSGNSQKDLPLKNDKEQTLNMTIQNENLLEQLLSPKQQNGNVPFQLKRKKKRKKRNLGL